MRLTLLFSLSFAFLALFPTALSQCLSGYRDVGSVCIPSNTISTFLSSRNTLYRFPFDNLSDSSGKGNVLVTSGVQNIVPVPGSSGSSGLRTSQRLTLPNIPITSNTCFYFKFFYPGLSYDFFLLALTNPPSSVSQFSIIVSKAGKLQVRTPAGRQDTASLIKKNTLNSIGVCLRPNGNVVTAVNGVRRATFTFAPVVSKQYNVNIGGDFSVVLDEILAYYEPESITYDHSLVFEQTPNYPYRTLGVLDLAPKTAAFTHVGKAFGKNSLFVTHFGHLTGPFTGSVEVVYDIGSKLNQIGTTTFQTVGTALTWPNTVLNAPFSALNKDNLITTASGFLAPFSKTGSVTLIDLNNPIQQYTISTPESGFFYHMTEWFDVDNDGLLDLLAAKSQFPTFPFARKLVWFKNPGTISGGWTESVLINNGPDLFFRLHDFDNDGKMEIVASISFANKISVFKNNGVFTNPSDWTEILIDNTIGLLFDVTLADMNKDGKLDLLVTNHVSNSSVSAVFVYEVPDDITTGKFVRHTIAVGSFVTTQPGSGQASPGGAVHFHPNVAKPNEKPYVLLSGDGTQRAYILRPLSNNPLNWDYDLKEILYGANTIGAVSVDDVDGDGYSELFVPVFEDGKVHVYTFSP